MAWAYRPPGSVLLEAVNELPNSHIIHPLPPGGLLHVRWLIFFVCLNSLDFRLSDFVPVLQQWLTIYNGSQQFTIVNVVAQVVPDANPRDAGDASPPH